MPKKTNRATKVLVCDDHSIFRAGLVGVLRAEPDIVVVGEARDGLEAIESTVELEPDVVIMDVLMPRCNGLEALDAIMKRCPNVKVVMLTISLHDEHLLQALRMGAQGYLLKSADIDEVVAAVKVVVDGQVMFSPEINVRIASQFRYPERGGQQPSKASQRETVVLEMLGQGMGNLEIANSLSISEATVRSYIRRLQRKLGLKTRAEVASYAAHHQDMTIETQKQS